MAGASLQEVKEILGHRTLTMTLRYAHLSPDHLRGAISRLDKVFRVAPAPALNGDSTAISNVEPTEVRK